MEENAERSILKDSHDEAEMERDLQESLYQMRMAAMYGEAASRPWCLITKRPTR